MNNDEPFHSVAGFEYTSEFDFFKSNEIAEPPNSFQKNLVIADYQRGLYLYHADSIEMMKNISAKHPEGCFDMIFADPPYFLSNGGITCQNGQMVSVNKGDWDKSRGIELNHSFNMDWLGCCQKLLKKNGTIWVTGTMHIIYSIGFAMQQLGFKILNDIIWEKTNPPPNLTCRYFTHATETVLWAAKNSDSKHYFNYEAMKTENGGKQMKSVWRIKPPQKSEKLFGKHPTQKPVELLNRCITASTQVGDFVLDPFAGSCTTGVVAMNLKRRFCGIELENSYIALSLHRLASTNQ